MLPLTMKQIMLGTTPRNRPERRYDIVLPFLSIRASTKFAMLIPASTIGITRSTVNSRSPKKYAVTHHIAMIISASMVTLPAEPVPGLNCRRMPNSIPMSHIARSRLQCRSA